MVREIIKTYRTRRAAEKTVQAIIDYSNKHSGSMYENRDGYYFVFTGRILKGDRAEMIKVPFWGSAINIRRDGFMRWSVIAESRIPKAKKEDRLRLEGL